MISSSILLSAALLALPAVSADDGPWNGRGPWGSKDGIRGPPPCLSSCDADQSIEPWINGFNSLCNNSTAIDTANTCIASSSCSDSDKQNTYQYLAQLCANEGYPLTATPEARFSATSGGTLWPTATWTETSGSGWGGAGWGAGRGPFGPKGGDDDDDDDGWGPWAGDKSGSWTAGPWTSWWGGQACPSSAWSGWTDGPWATNAPWTTWTACTASTTSTGVVTATVTVAGTTRVVPSTTFGLSVAQVTGAANGEGVGAVGLVAVGLAGGLAVVVNL